MNHVYHVKLGDSRRIALPADLCRKLDMLPGEELLVTQSDDGLAITSLRRQAQRMRQELREMIGKGASLTADLKKLRTDDAVRETDPR